MGNNHTRSRSPSKGQRLGNNTAIKVFQKLHFGNTNNFLEGVNNSKSDEGIIEQGSHQFNRPRKGSIFEQTISGSQKGWELKTYDSLEIIKRGHTSSSFQDGGLHCLKEHLIKRDYISKLDLKDTYFYFCIP